MIAYFFVVVSSFLLASAQDMQYEPIGCFKDDANIRALPTLVGNFRSQIDWSDLSKVVKMCAEAVEKREFQVFSLQFYGECWSGKDAGLTYNEYGPSDDCDEVNKVGKHWTNYVYRFVSQEKKAD